MCQRERIIIIIRTPEQKIIHGSVGEDEIIQSIQYVAFGPSHLYCLRLGST